MSVDAGVLTHPYEDGVLMTSSRRRPLGVRVVIAATIAVVAFFGLPGQYAQAFYIINHETITRNALPPDQVDNAALAQILVGPPPGAGAVGSDAFFSDEFRHIDNATNPTEVCARAQQAWNTFEPVILSGAQSASNGLANGPSARAAFGGLIHAQQDLYAHSNWVELNIAAGQLDRLAPPIFPTCDPAAFPTALHTGYFSLQFGNHEEPLSGCPPDGPPPGFQECHSTLNKDGPATPRGSQPVPGTNMNMYEVAAQLATTATTQLYQQIRGVVASTNGQDAATCLFQASLPQCGGAPNVPLPTELPPIPAGLTTVLPTTGLGPPPN
jgi:hypothetical protein